MVSSLTGSALSSENSDPDLYAGSPDGNRPRRKHDHDVMALSRIYIERSEPALNDIAAKISSAGRFTIAGAPQGVDALVLAQRALAEGVLHAAS